MMSTLLVDQSISSALIDELCQIFPGQTARDYDLRRMSRWRIGGTADVVVDIASIDDLRRLRAWLHDNDVPSMVFSGTSNLLFSEAGLRPVGIRIGASFSGVEVKGRSLRAKGGTYVPCVTRAAMKAGLTGIEHACGIPGSIGGLICMNGGSQRKGIGSHVTTVTSIDPQGRLVKRAAEECQFAYRQSIFQTKDEVVAEVVLQLEGGGSPSGIRREMLEIMAQRRAKFPTKQPNCGSVFVSSPELYERFGPPGQIIESLGLKGRRVGGAQISPLHANFIVNDAAASAGDVLALIDLVNSMAKKELGEQLFAEVRYVASDGRQIPAHLATGFAQAEKAAS